MSDNIDEFETVVLTGDHKDGQLKAGDVGTVVSVYPDGRGYEVEFQTLAGKTIAVLTLPASALRPISEDEIATARAVA